jgi:hypothetical protein
MPAIPRPIVSVHGEDVDVEVPGLLTIRATFLSEGLFDSEAGGNPDEEDLYEVEVTHHVDEEILEPITFPRLMPASSRELPDDEADWDAAPAILPIEPFLLALAWELANAHPSNWSDLCEGARHWDPWTIEDVLVRLPTEWTPEPLIPDDDL